LLFKFENYKLKRRDDLTFSGLIMKSDPTKQLTVHDISIMSAAPLYIFYGVARRALPLEEIKDIHLIRALEKALLPLGEMAEFSVEFLKINLPRMFRDFERDSKHMQEDQLEAGFMRCLDVQILAACLRDDVEHLNLTLRQFARNVAELDIWDQRISLDKRLAMHHRAEEFARLCF